MVEVTRALSGVNAQQDTSMLLSLRARVRGLSREDVYRALEDERTLLRTWAMRGTLHLLDSSDLVGLVTLLGPTFTRADAGRRRQLGLDDGVLSKARDTIPGVLGPHALTRHELVDRLISEGLEVDAEGQAPIHLIAWMALQGLMCLGPDRENGESTYVLVDRWVGRGAGAAAKLDLGELISRYITAFGPADHNDFVRWSGLKLTRVKGSWPAPDDRRFSVGQADGRLLWFNGRKPPGRGSDAPSVRLLPAFDNYVLGYADRDYVVPPGHAGDVYHGGQTAPVILMDGRAVGTWRYHRRGKRLYIEAGAFGRLSEDVWDLVFEEALDIGRMLSSEVTLQKA